MCSQVGLVLKGCTAHLKKKKIQTLSKTKVYTVHKQRKKRREKDIQQPFGF